MKVTPAAHRWPSPERSSWRLGLMTAATSGSRSSAWWWSTTITSAPSGAAAASGVDAGGAAVDGDDEAGALAGERCDRLRRWGRSPSVMRSGM